MFCFSDWNNADFNEKLLENVVEKSHFTKPRRIQSAVVPLLQKGNGNDENFEKKKLNFLNETS